LAWTRGRRWSTWAGRLGLLALVVLASCDPVWHRTETRPWVSVLVERSANTGEQGVQAWQAWQAAPDRPAADYDVIYYGDTPRPVAEVEGEWPEPQGEGDLRLAWALAELRRPPGRTGPALIFSSGRGPQPDHGTWAPSGRPVSWVGVGAPDLPDVAVTAIRAPERLRPGDPFVWEVDLRATGGVTTATVEMERGGLREPTRTVDLASGAATLRVSDRATEQIGRRLEVTVRAEGDARPANDQLSAHRPVDMPGRIWLITDRPDQAAPWAAALRAEGLRLEVRPLEGLPRDPATLPPGTVLVLDNVPAAAVPLRFQIALGPWLRQGHGGLLVLGGDRSLGPGGYRDTELGSWLPVEPRFERDEERPVLGLVLAIDRSGSMAGEKLALAQAAALAAAEALAPRDLLGVITFDAEATWAFEPSPALDRAGLQRRLAAVTAGGGTSISPALDRALERLPNLPVSRRHLILLTDGQSQPGPLVEQIRRLSAAGVTTSTVGVGADADRLLLELLAREGGGRFYYTPDPRRVPQIFVRETEMIAQTGFREQPFLAQPGRRARWLEAAFGGTAPRLRGYALAEAKPGADVWLRTETGDPLLASWRVGLGRAAVFTSDARARWASDWLAWERFGAFWAGVLRHLQPPPGGAVEGLATTRSATGWSWAWEPPETAEGGAEVPEALILQGADGSEQRLPWVATLPGRWEAASEGAAAGRWQVEVAMRSADGTERRRVVGEIERRRPGADAGPPDLRVLASAAVASQGRLDPPDWAAVPGMELREPGAVPVALGPWLWALALLLFPVEVWWRRRPVRLSGVRVAPTVERERAA